MPNERWKLMRELAPGDLIAMEHPISRASVVSGKPCRQIERDHLDRPVREHDGWLLIFDFRTGPRDGQREHVIGLPDWKVRLA
jgi:hypothetical protein